MTQALPDRAALSRDLRIDFLRGLFIVSLGGTHFAWFANAAGYRHWLRFYDIQPFGFSSPAEFFVFFSGYVLSLVYARKFQATGFWLSLVRTLDRSWSIYVLNVFTFAIIAGLVSVIFVRSPDLQILSGVARLDADPLRFIARFLIFRDNLAFFEILRNYIFFLPLVAPFLLIGSKYRYLPLSISIGVWLLHQVGLTPSTIYTTFNPFGWQLIFFLGTTCAQVMPISEWRFPRRKMQIMLCLALLLGAFIMRHLLFAEYEGAFLPYAHKADIGPLRLLHFCLVLWTAMLILPSSETLARYGLVRAFVKVGQNSLECFCLSNVLVYSGAAVITLDPPSIPLYLATLVTVFAALLAGGHIFGWMKSEPWRKK